MLLTSGGQQVVGMFHHPAGRAPAPAVLLIHGFTGNKVEAFRVFVRTARRLAATGIAALRIDCRGCGDSGGEFRQMTVSTETEDVLAALAWLRAHAGVDPGRLGLLGYSMGSLPAVAALADDGALRAAALWSPVAHPARLVAARSYPGWEGCLEEHDAVYLEAWEVGKGLVDELLAIDPLEIARSIRVPVLIVHGDRDESVPVESSDAYETVFRESGIRHRKIIVPGALHLYNTPQHQEALQSATVEWFLDQGLAP